MREILFRGKEESGKWRYGHLITADWYSNGKTYIVERGWKCQIVPETVGQYTGLTDNNGIKIFEGDIVRLYGDKNNPDTKMIDYNAFVIFKSGRFCAINGTENNYSFERIIFNSYLNCEVISNIHENLELLEIEE